MEISREGNALHLKVKESIIQLIKSGEYKPNTQLPTEAEFCKKYNVSRTTVRTALQQLAVEGYVYRKQGKGTFVSNNKVKQILTTTVEQFSEQVAMQGKKPAIKVLSLEVIQADPFLAEAFDINENDPVNKLVRIRYVNEEPLQYEIAFLPWNKTPGLNKEACETSLYKFLESHFHLKVKKTVEHLELILADQTISNQLNIGVGSPCFSLETHAYLEDGTAIEYSKTIYRGDLVNFVIERNY